MPCYLAVFVTTTLLLDTSVHLTLCVLQLCAVKLPDHCHLIKSWYTG